MREAEAPAAATAPDNPQESSKSALTLPDKTSIAVLPFTDQARFGWEKDKAKAFEVALECAARDLTADPSSYLAYLTIGYARLFQRHHGLEKG